MSASTESGDGESDGELTREDVEQSWKQFSASTEMFTAFKHVLNEYGENITAGFADALNTFLDEHEHEIERHDDVISRAQVTGVDVSPPDGLTTNAALRANATGSGNPEDYTPAGYDQWKANAEGDSESDDIDTDGPYISIDDWRASDRSTTIEGRNGREVHKRNRFR